MKIYIYKEAEDNVVVSLNENLCERGKRALRVEEIDLPKSVETLIKSFLDICDQFDICDNRGVALTLVANEAFQIGLKWSSKSSR